MKKVGPIEVVAVMANKFKVDDANNVQTDETRRILTTGGECYARARSAFKFLFEQITPQEYAYVARQLTAVSKDHDPIMKMPEYGDSSFNALSKINNTFTLTEFCGVVWRTLSTKITSPRPTHNQLVRVA